MSYDHRLLFEQVSLNLNRNPGLSLRKLARQLRISRRTIQNVVSAFAGKRFSDLRDEIMLAKVQNLMLVTPVAAIKELAFESGYRSPRSFARAVRRACGESPQQLRARIAKDQIRLER